MSLNIMSLIGFIDSSVKQRNGRGVFWRCNFAMKAVFKTIYGSNQHAVVLWKLWRRIVRPGRN